MSKTAASNALLQLDGVVTDAIRRLSCEIVPGQVVRFMCPTHEAREQLWSLLVDGKAPLAGSVELAGYELSNYSARGRLALCQKIGVVPQDGGLISNLKVWENLVLPTWYHRATDPAMLDHKAVAIFRGLGLDQEAIRKLVQRLPDQLTMIERRWVAAVRAMLMEPDIMMIDAPFAGVEREAANRLLQVLLQFHRDRTDRVTIFLLPDEPFSERVSADVTIVVGA